MHVHAYRLPALVLVCAMYYVGANSACVHPSPVLELPHASDTLVAWGEDDAQTSRSDRVYAATARALEQIAMQLEVRVHSSLALDTSRTRTKGNGAPQGVARSQLERHLVARSDAVLTHARVAKVLCSNSSCRVLVVLDQGLTRAEAVAKLESIDGQLEASLGRFAEALDRADTIAGLRAYRKAQQLSVARASRLELVQSLGAPLIGEGQADGALAQASARLRNLGTLCVFAAPSAEASEGLAGLVAGVLAQHGLPFEVSASARACIVRLRVGGRVESAPPRGGMPLSVALGQAKLEAGATSLGAWKIEGRGLAILGAQSAFIECTSTGGLRRACERISACVSAEPTLLHRQGEQLLDPFRELNRAPLRDARDGRMRRDPLADHQMAGDDHN